jgi:glycosyltransferase involved in cell wall biosynthesis
MSTSENPLISIVIPARNERHDIRATLDACLAIQYAPKEIIVVDDSTDDTPSIVTEYAERGVRLVHREANRNGCCGARNLGMQLARGEIIVLLNADNRPAPDFLARLTEHYRNGADYVVVRSRVMNLDSLWARYIAAAESEWLSHRPPMEWSEGFSCRRSAAEAVHYIPGDFAVPFCRDWRLGLTLNHAGFVKHQDMNIDMAHIAPATLKEFWHNHLWRGGMSPLSTFYLSSQPLPLVYVREGLRALRSAVKIVFVVPAWLNVWKLMPFASHGRLEFPAMLTAYTTQQVALSVGALKALLRLTRVVTGSDSSWRGSIAGDASLPIVPDRTHNP